MEKKRTWWPCVKWSQVWRCPKLTTIRFTQNCQFGGKAHDHFTCYQFIYLLYFLLAFSFLLSPVAIVEYLEPQQLLEELSMLTNTIPVLPRKKIFISHISKMKDKFPLGASPSLLVPLTIPTNWQAVFLKPLFDCDLIWIYLWMCWILTTGIRSEISLFIGKIKVRILSETLHK